MMTESEPPNEEGEITPKIKEELAFEAEDDTNGTGKQSNFSNFTEVLAKEIKTEEIDVESEDLSYNAVVSSTWESDRKLSAREDISKNFEENIEIGKVWTSVDNFSTIKTEENTKNEENLPNSASITKEVCESSESSFIKSNAKFLTEDNIDVGKEEVVSSSADYATARNEETLLQSTPKIEKVDENVEIKSDEELHTEEDIEDNIETPEHEEKVFQSVIPIKHAAQRHEENLIPKLCVFSSDIMSALVKDESNSITYYNDVSEQCMAYYDSSHIKLMKVSVVVKDLFQEISRCGSDKPLRKHMNSKLCRCIFCTRKFKLLKKRKGFVVAEVREKTRKSSPCAGKHFGADESWNSCAVCFAQFRFMFALRRHSAMNHRMYLCSECPSKFQLESELRNHLKTHPVCGPYVCPFCSFTGRVEAELEIHARIHSTENSFSCSQCFVEFSEIYKLLNHIKEHEMKDIVIKSETDLEDGESVLNNSFSESKNSSFLTFSYKQSPTKSCLPNLNQKHYLKSDLTTNVNAQSSSCNTSTESVTTSPVLHSLTSCTECLPSDLQNKTQVNSKSYLYSLCTKIFDGQNNQMEASLNNKATSHSAGENSKESTNRNWESCSLCLAQFRFKHLLRRHCAVNHRIFLCSECPTKFQRESDLNSHLKTHPMRKLFNCTFCSFKGRVETELEIHSRIHSTKKLFSCAECLIEFDRCYILLDHILTHSSREAADEFKNKLNLSENSADDLNCSPVSNQEVDVGSKDDASVDSSHTCISFETDPVLNEKDDRVKENKSVDSLTAIPIENQTNYNKGKILRSATCKEACTKTAHASTDPGFSLENQTNDHERKSLQSKTWKPARTKQETYKLVDSAISCKKQRSSDYDKKSLQSVTISCKNNNEFNSEASIVSSDSKASSSSGMNTLDKKQYKTSFDYNGIKIVNSLVILEDLFLKIPKDQSPRHINSNVCKCVFCTGKYKLYSGEKLLKPKADKHSGSNLCAEKLVEKSVNKKWISCKSCPARFRFMHNLKSHAAIDHHVYLCPECYSEFQLEADLETHLKTHSIEKLYFCAFCSFKSNFEENLKRHAKIHSTEKLFSCARCFSKFDQIFSLLDHIPTHSKKEATVKFKHSIDIDKHSSVVASTSSSVKTHVIEPTDVERFNVGKMTNKHEFLTQSVAESQSVAHVSKLPSDKQSSSSFEMVSKNKSVTSSCVESYSQNFGRTKMTNKQESTNSSVKRQPSKWKFPSVKMMTKHKSQLSVHSKQNLQHTPTSKTKQEIGPHLAVDSKEKRFSCATCLMAFKFKGNLKQHIMRIHLNERPFACVSCTATFKSKSEVKAHSAIHSTSCPFSCQHCDAKFKTKARLQKHSAVHLKEKLYRCATCDARFKTKDSIRIHVALHSTEKAFACRDCTATFQTKSQLQVHSESHLTVKRFSCSECAAAFTSKAKLKRHLVCHSSERPFACALCDATFKKKSQLKRHADVHATERRFSCPICSASFKGKRDVATHLAVHSAERPHACLHCPKRFKTKITLNSHAKAHSNQRPYACSVCTATFKSKSEVTAHLVIHSDLRPFRCPLCPKAFKLARRRNRHLSTIHSGERPFTCSDCAATFKTKNEISTHIMAVHATERPHSCQLCAKTFKTKTHLRQHLPIHSTEKLFSCQHCTATFKDKRALKSHSYVHAPKERVPCPQCNNTFKNKQILKHHLESVHANDRPFGCPECTATFKTKQVLTQHLDVHSKERNFACGQCNLTFKCKRFLRSHLTIHSNLKPFKCDLCPSTFKTKPELKSHSVVHSDNKPFLCVHCDARFKTKTGLGYHLKVHSNEKLYSCALCDAKFKTKGCIKSHLVVHSTEKPFLCKLCSARFRSKQLLKAHAVSHSDQRPFLCSKCPGAFKSKTSLNEHLITHSKVPSYPCTRCSAAFKSRRGLKYHLASHSK